VAQEDRKEIADFARPPRLSEQARDGGQGLRIADLRYEMWDVRLMN